MAEMLYSLIENDIPEGKTNLLHLADKIDQIALLCQENFNNAPSKMKALDETKNYMARAVSNVAVQLNFVAGSFIQLLDTQNMFIDETDINIKHFSQWLSIMKEKMDRREIGLLTTNKNVSRNAKVLKLRSNNVSAQNSCSTKYVRKPIDYTQFDQIGHVAESFNASVDKQDISSSNMLYSEHYNQLYSNNNNSNMLLNDEFYHINGPANDLYGVVAKNLPSNQNDMSNNNSYSRGSGTNHSSASNSHILNPNDNTNNNNNRILAHNIFPLEPTRGVDPYQKNQFNVNLDANFNPSPIYDIYGACAYPSKQIPPSVNQESPQLIFKENFSNGNFVIPTFGGSIYTNSNPYQQTLQNSSMLHQECMPTHQFNHQIQQNMTNIYGSSIGIKPTAYLGGQQPFLLSPHSGAPIYSQVNKQPSQEYSQMDQTNFLVSPNQNPFSNMNANQSLSNEPNSNPNNHLSATNNYNNPQTMHNPSPMIQEAYIEKVVALYDYTMEKADELSFKENEIIHVLKKNDDGWWEGILDGRRGLFPGNYVEPLT